MYIKSTDGLHNKFLSSFIFLFLFITPLQAELAKGEFYLILLHAQIYTVNDQKPWAEALVIDGQGKIKALGSNTEISASSYAQSAQSQIIDMSNKMILPGFQDAHVHAIEAGINANYCLLSQFGSADDYLNELSQCVQDYGDDAGWVIAAGVNMDGLLEAVKSPLNLIDEIIPNRPTIVLDDIGHGTWANSKALELAGFHRLKNDPQGGILVRDEDDQFMGVVLESASQTLLDAAQKPTKAYLKFAENSLEEALSVFAQNGITTISDAGGYWPRNHDQVWHQMEADERLTVRASNALYVYPNKSIDQQIIEFKKRFSNAPNRLVRINQAKIYVDGIITLATSALYQPYSTQLELSDDEALGFEYFSRDKLIDYVQRLSQAGFQIHFHATGDRGVGLALDALEQAQTASRAGLMHRITHLYMVAPQDQSRFKDLNVVADFQMASSSLSPDYQDYLKFFIGSRAQEILPLLPLLQKGALVTLSSDWDADEISPFKKLKTVLTRYQEDEITLATALKMMTINPAKLLQHDDKTGTIEIGKYADLVIIDQNLFDLPAHKLDQVKVIATLLAGEAIYDPQNIFDEVN